MINPISPISFCARRSSDTPPPRGGDNLGFDIDIEGILDASFGPSEKATINPFDKGRALDYYKGDDDIIYLGSQRNLPPLQTTALAVRNENELIPVGQELDIYEEGPQGRNKKQVSSKQAFVIATACTVLAVLASLLWSNNQGDVAIPQEIVEDFKGEVPSENVLEHFIETRTPKEAEMIASNNCKDLIKDAEGYRSEAYKCDSGQYTVGWGHRRGVEANEVITEEQAEIYLQEDINEAIKYIYAYVKVPLTQGQFDALVSFVFNCGAGNFKESTLLRLVNEGNYEAAANEFPRWVYGTDPATGEKVPLSGLERRRAAEENLFRGLGNDN